MRLSPRRAAALGIFAVGAVLLSGCHVLNQRDVFVVRSGATVTGLALRDTDLYNDGTCFDTTPCPYAPDNWDAFDTVFGDLWANCENAGDWGTFGDPMDPVDSDVGACVEDQVTDDSTENDEASFICYDEDAAPNQHDCQDDATPPNYTADSAATAYYRAAVAEDPIQFATTIRDWPAFNTTTGPYPPETYCIRYLDGDQDWVMETSCPG